MEKKKKKQKHGGAAKAAPLSARHKFGSSKAVMEHLCRCEWCMGEETMQGEEL